MLHINTLKMLRLPQGMKTSSSIFQNSSENTLKETKGLIIFQGDLLVFRTSRAMRKKVRHRIINEIKSLTTVLLLNYSFSADGIKPAEMIIITIISLNHKIFNHFLDWQTSTDD